ncbi:MAG: hypothetical protein HKP25_09915 [Marinicaulis sp.]|nr:hypothetical protein [Marinicaulis sp.]NNL89375.1 hypothetical protein [Marinicaulis sp.]
MSDIISPPKPVLAFRVGVTGHRLSRLDPSQIGRINQQVNWILATVEAGMRVAHKKFAVEYADKDPIQYFVSALADGADTLAAQCALENKWRLLAPLPFSKKLYQTDFSPTDRDEFETLINDADAIAELDGLRNAPAQEDRAYLQAGLVTLDQSDLLIAIWDGEEARGVGGTAMIKEEALTAGKPVLWINANHEKPIVFLTTDNEEQVVTEEAVAEAIERVVAPPSMEEVEHPFAGQDTHALMAYHQYAEEHAHKINWGSFFQFWEKAFAGKWPFTIALLARSPASEIENARKSTLAEKLAASSHDQKVFNDLIIPRFAWADHLAIYYGNLYRSSYYFNYMFAAVAVFLALLDLVMHDYHIGSKTLWISIEVTLICLILLVTTAGKRGRWHEKWIDYRQLAEELRMYRLYFLTLGFNSSDEEIAKGEGGEAAGWVDWYFAATRREAGMTSGAFDKDSIQLIAKTILEEEIKPQISYHGGKADMLHKIEHRLHHYGEYAFGATLLVCLGYLTLVVLAGDTSPLAKWAKYTKYDVKNWVTMLTGFLPALGASFFGIRVQGEFGSTAERSHATAAQLQNMSTKFEAIINAKTPRLEMLRIRISEAARAMLMENMDWRLVYISKPLNLPG